MKRNRKIQYIALFLAGLILLLMCGIQNESEDVSCIKITEVCSNNDTIIYDDRGRYFDYIELHNDSENPVDLDGWCLTDSPDEKEVGLFLEDVVLEAGEYHVAFVAKQTCNFALSEGDSIYLYDDEGETIDTIAVPMIEDEKKSCLA